MWLIANGQIIQPEWHRYEHINRNNGEYDRIADYIENNPVNWSREDENLGDEWADT